jgi:hypothetical protein
MARSKSELMRACERVNKILEAEAKEKELGTKKSLARMDEARQLDKVAFSYWATLEFQEYVRRELEKHPAINASILINNGARLLHLSPVTTKRYLAVMRAGEGPFRGMGDVVMLNPNYTSADGDYWQDVPGQEEGGEEG